MKEIFTDEQIEEGLNEVVIEEDDLVLYAETIEGEGKNYVLTGKAVIEGETYHEFQMEFQLLEEPESYTVEEIMNSDWDWYDYLC